MTDPFSPLSFARGPAMKNRLILVPMTNQQSHADGQLSDEEYRWLTMRPEGGFGLGRPWRYGLPGPNAH